MQNVEEQFIKQHIFEAQNIDLQAIIGESLYKLIIDEFTAYFDALSSNPNAVVSDFVEEWRLKLVNDYASNVIVYYSVYYSAYDLSSKFTNKGTTVKSSQNSIPADLERVQIQRRDYRQKGDYYIQQMIDFITSNIEHYPEFESSCNDLDFLNTDIYLGDE